MISDLDIYRTAKLLVDKHGAEAPIHAAMKADAMFEKGDMDGRAVWLRVIKEIEELQHAERLAVDRRERPLRVRNGPSATPPGRSAPGGEADEISAKADIGARTSAIGGKADVPATWPESPFLATTGHWLSAPRVSADKEALFQRLLTALTCTDCNFVTIWPLP